MIWEYTTPYTEHMSKYNTPPVTDYHGKYEQGQWFTVVQQFTEAEIERTGALLLYRTNRQESLKRWFADLYPQSRSFIVGHVNLQKEYMSFSWLMHVSLQMPVRPRRTTLVPRYRSWIECTSKSPSGTHAEYLMTDDYLA